MECQDGEAGPGVNAESAESADGVRSGKERVVFHKAGAVFPELAVAPRAGCVVLFSALRTARSAAIHRLRLGSPSSFEL